MLGPHFPSGVFDWPPKEWVQSYRERKERVRDSKVHCDEPDNKRQRLLGATDVEERTQTKAAGSQPKSAGETRTVAAGCQPTSARETLTEALARPPKSAGQTRI